MGRGISHRGGPITEAAVDEILAYFESRLKKEGLKEVPDRHARADGAAGAAAGRGRDPAAR